MRQTRSGFLFLFLFLLITPAAARALTYVVVPDASLADQAEVIAWIEITDARPSRDAGGVWTRYRATVRETVVGSVAESELTIRVPGALVGNRRQLLHVWGAPRLRAGDRALVFLAGNRDRSYRILHVAQGLFREVGSSLLIRELPEHGRLSVGGSGEPAGSGRDGARFAAWLRDRAAGIERPPDYFLDARAESRDVLQPSFRLLGRSLGFRWLEFDRGGEVKWHRDEQSQPGLARTAQVVKTALSAWSGKATGTPVRLRLAGTTSSQSGVGAADGRNSVMFRDVNEAIGDDFDCPAGGVLTLSGITGFAPANVRWKEQDFVVITEADVVINDGAECLFAVYPSVATQVLVHELGHALGLGHACEPFREVCSRYTADATMAALLHKPGRADRLGLDDLIGLRYIYDAGADTVSCSLQPGHKNFCKQCGPCGEGQGSCRSDQECAGDLVCAKDAGFALGYDRDGGNACLAPE